MPYYEDDKEFSVRQGCNRIDIGSNRTVYENGATIEGGIRHEPPENEWKLLAIQREYWQEKLDREVRGFTGYQQQLINEAQWAKRYRNMSAPDEDDLEPLRAGTERIEAIKAKLAEIDERLEKSPAAKARRSRELQDERDQMHINDILGKIKSFDV